MLPIHLLSGLRLLDDYSALRREKVAGLDQVSTPGKRCHAAASTYVLFVRHGDGRLRVDLPPVSFLERLLDALRDSPRSETASRVLRAYSRVA